MGIVANFKRWQLIRQGLASGKKRREHRENQFVRLLEDSFLLRIIIYVLFALGTAALVLKGSAESSHSSDGFKGGAYGFLLASMAVAVFHVSLQSNCQRNRRAVLVFGGLIGHLLIVRLLMTFSQFGTFPEAFRFLLVPFALAPMLHSVLLGRAVGTFSTMYVSLLGCLLIPKKDVLAYLILSLVSGLVAVMFTHEVRKRGQVLRAGLYVGAVIFGVALLVGSIDVASCFGPNAFAQLKFLGTGSALAFGTALLTSLFVSGLLPFFETTFRVTTDISWLELSDLNHKLLRQMQLEAPGTFHHSLVVASLAEAAAESIGANAQLCRVCAYFHDIGKLKKPVYFIENQSSDAGNPHDALTPTMSALVIISHVKDGVDLAVKHNLNPRIIDVIQEHHGDSLVIFFYRRAQEQKRAELEKVGRRLENPEDLPQVEEKSFRYAGPRPRSRESGIIALADTVESASRTLRNPNPAKIRALIEDLVRSKMNDGQLDDCVLTCREVATIKESFSSTLRSMLHTRVDYPVEEPSRLSVIEKDPLADRSTSTLTSSSSLRSTTQS